MTRIAMRHVTHLGAARHRSQERGKLEGRWEFGAWMLEFSMCAAVRIDRRRV